jgi:hypothetical protein
MRTISVDKQQLKESLLSNRETHKELFETAWEGYRKFAIKELEDRLEAVKNKKPFKLWFDVSVPEDHTKDYDTALEMLDWHTEDVVNLTRDEFDKFIKDDWSWKGKFGSDVATYSAIELDL